MSAPTPSLPSGDPSLPEKGFKPCWWGWIGLVLTCSLTLLDAILIFATGRLNDASAGYVVGRATGGMLCPMFLTLCFGTLFGRKVSRRAGSIAMNVVQLPFWLIFITNFVAGLARAAGR